MSNSIRAPTLFSFIVCTLLSIRDRRLLYVFYDALNYINRVFGSMKKHLSDVVKQADLLYPQ